MTSWTIATLAMIADHVGALLYPDVWAFRGVGRLAFPLYSLGIATGMQRTGNRRAYLLRLALLAIPSEGVHWWAFGTWGSPVTMLLVGACILQTPQGVQVAAVLLGVLLGPWVGPWVLSVAWAHGTLPAALVMMSHAGSNWVQGLALAAIPVALMARGGSPFHGFAKWLKYVCYPAHLAAIKAFALLT